jgi:hypothetical protein
MRSLVILAILAGGLAFGGSTAHAQGGWCVDYDAYTHTCGFTSYGQCMATASGNGGYCRPDPFEQRVAPPPPPRVEYHKPRRHKKPRHHD